jgi:hypothetical protein
LKKYILSGLFLEESSSFQISQKFHNVSRHGRRSGQVVTGGLESIFISNPVDGDNNVVGSGVRVATTGNGTDILRFGSNQFLFSNLFDFSSVFTCEAEAVASIGGLVALVAAVAAAPAELEVKPVAIVRSASDQSADGSYSFSFESEDGTKVEEVGEQKLVGPEPEDIGTVSRGSYSHTGPDNVVVTVNWVADENGFQATGDHLPTPPPMPAHVVKLLADLEAAGLLKK